MPALRNALRLLLDESQPIGERLDRLIRPEGANLIRGLDQAVITPILLVVYPNRYGVWNTISEAAMRQLGLWPSSERGSSFGEQYEIVNQVLNETAATLEIDLWTLDALWWAVEERTDAVGAPDRRYWLFQANPTLWDLEANLRELVVGDEGDWSVTRFGDEMQSGDGVVLWSAGESAGIYAIGQLSSDVFERPYEGFTSSGPTESGTEPAIRFRHTAILDAPILKSELVEHPTLGALSVIRSPQGSNFHVTAEEWAAIQDLLPEDRSGAVWWVNQGQTYEQARVGGFLWAPPIRTLESLACIELGAQGTSGW